MADTKISSLTEDTAPTADDLLVTVNDPAGTPANRKVTLENFTTELNKSAAHASAPSAGWTGRVFWPTDSFYLRRDNNTLLAPYGPIFPLTEPISGDFAWINQGTSTISTTNGGVHIAMPSTASVNVVIRKKAAPSVPYTITAFILPLIPLTTGAIPVCGLCFRQASDGKLHTYNMYIIDSNPGDYLVGMSASKYTSATAFSADYSSVNPVPFALSCGMFLRIADDNTNRICSWSIDGVNFAAFHTIGRTDFLTADEVGFFVGNVTSSAASAMTLISWKEG